MSQYRRASTCLYAMQCDTMADAFIKHYITLHHIIVHYRTVTSSRVTFDCHSHIHLQCMCRTPYPFLLKLIPYLNISASNSFFTNSFIWRCHYEMHEKCVHIVSVNLQQMGATAIKNINRKISCRKTGLIRMKITLL